MNMKNILYIILFSPLLLMAQEYKIASPDANILLTITKNDGISFKATYKGAEVISRADIGMDLGDNGKIHESRIREVSRASGNGIKTVIVSHKDRTFPVEYNELTLRFRSKDQLVFRVYNDGIAYRFESIQRGEVTVMDELLALQFPEGTTSWWSPERSLYSHYEQAYQYQAIDTIPEGQFTALPIRYDVENVGVLITEADQFDYPGLFLEKSGEHSFKSKFPHYILDIRPNPRRPDRYEVIDEEADYIAKTGGNRSYPWRVIMISDDDRDFVESNLVMALSRPNQLEETDWIQPGRIAWDWYNANNIWNVDFESGINTETYKYYIDFASEFGLEYVILDEGWTKTTTEVMESNLDIDIPELVAYGKEKNVELILWVLWHPLVKNLDGILSLYSSWDVAGIKVDFMQRADQAMVKSYEEIAETAARYKLLVDFHGAFKPAGLRSAYPNVMTYEGVRGGENNKWSEDCTPDHNVTLPFTRMVAGPMDYTPGAMRNAQRRNYNISYYRPMSQGTRCHQAAMYVVYESPLQMFCDAPTAYLEDTPYTAFISRIPADWDETHVLEGKISDYIVVARRKGDTWYLGAMTDWDARDFKVNLDFLGEGEFNVDIVRDGVNASKYAEDYKLESKVVTSSDQLDIEMAPGGGWVAIISPK